PIQRHEQSGGEVPVVPRARQGVRVELQELLPEPTDGLTPLPPQAGEPREPLPGHCIPGGQPLPNRAQRCGQGGHLLAVECHVGQVAGLEAEQPEDRHPPGRSTYTVLYFALGMVSAREGMGLFSAKSVAVAPTDTPSARRTSDWTTSGWSIPGGKLLANEAPFGP